MAEGTSRTVPESVVAEGEEEVVEAVTPEESEARVVQPKERKAWSEDRPVESQEKDKGTMQSAAGHWWHSSVLTGPGEPRDRTPPPFGGAPFQGWKGRQWMEEDEQDWSYSTSPGPNTMEVQ